MLWSRTAIGMSLGLWKGHKSRDRHGARFINIQIKVSTVHERYRRVQGSIVRITVVTAKVLTA